MPAGGQGFTLIEILLTIGIAATVILAVSGIYMILVTTRVKNQVIGEAEGQAAAAMQNILQTIRNSVSITAPGAGTSGTSLTIFVIDPVKNPTVYDESAGVLRIKEGSSSAVALTNARIIVSSLTFQNLSATGSAGSIRARFTVTSLNNSGRNEYDYSKIVTGSASVRR